MSILVKIALGVLVVAFVFSLSIWLYGYLQPKRRRERRERRRVRAGRGLGVGELARRLGETEEVLRGFEPRYGLKLIKKRRGGMRRLQIPDERTKEIQRKILRKVLGRLRAHVAAHGFERGRSIVTNAQPHVGKVVVIKLDVRDFFQNTRAERVDAYFRRVGWNAEAAGVLTRLVTHEGGLPQGAPTSPRLSNLVNYILDVKLSGIARKREITYTRYADDITFSCGKDYPSRVRGVVQMTRHVLGRLGYSLNPKKVAILRRHQQQRVTGLVVNDGVNVPREVRRRLRAVAHRLKLGQEATMTEAELAGYEAYVGMVRKGREG